jgi:hypothetical protein
MRRDLPSPDGKAPNSQSPSTSTYTATAANLQQKLDRVPDPDAFDWDNPAEDSIILREQRTTAAYHNKVGELIIRQRAAFDEEHDSFVYVSPENEVAFLEALAVVHRGDRS